MPSFQDRTANAAFLDVLDSNGPSSASQKIISRHCEFFTVVVRTIHPRDTYQISKLPKHLSAATVMEVETTEKRCSRIAARCKTEAPDSVPVVMHSMTITFTELKEYDDAKDHSQARNANEANANGAARRDYTPCQRPH